MPSHTVAKPSEFSMWLPSRLGEALGGGRDQKLRLALRFERFKAIG
jgi:hypothetical protein